MISKLFMKTCNSEKNMMSVACNARVVNFQEEALEKKSKQMAAERYLREQQQLAIEQKQLVKRMRLKWKTWWMCIFGLGI